MPWSKIALMTGLCLILAGVVFSLLGMRAVNQATDAMLNERITTAGLVASYLDQVLQQALNVPGMDGLEATRRISKKHPKTKILILTQHDNREYILSAIKAGVAGYGPKRPLGSELVAAIHAVYRGDSFLYPSAASALIEDYLRGVDQEPYDRLTAREREVLRLIAEGHTSREIASLLFIRLKTVLRHRTKIMGKLDIHNRTELIKYAMRKGLVSMET